MRRVAFLVLVLSPIALSSAAGTIQVDRIQTYDTGIRLLNGRSRIGADVKMTYLNFMGVVVDTQWQANLYINNIHNGSLLAGTGTLTFNTKVWSTSVEAYAGYDACYQGKAYAAAGGDVQQVGGNHVCTAPRPPSDPPPCDDDCQTPIVLSLHGGYRMTSPAEGVFFDIDGDGDTEQIAWTVPDDSVGFLALDRNGNGRIDSGAELFGNHTSLATGGVALNGFEALAELDSNHDGTIDAKDPSWRHLLLWIDTNHDGSSSTTELRSIPSSGVTAISTDYQRSGRKDRFGNEFRYKGEFRLAEAWRPCYDVYLVAN